MKLQTLGHASILIKNEEDQPLLLTDPWLIGSCYWRSWWLQNYPSESQLAELANVKYCYVTHEHPDHYHLPSIRKLGKNPTFISPELPEGNISSFLNGMGCKTQTLKSLQWYKIDANCEILSIPLYNDDSCLLVNTPNAFIINLNDSKPSEKQLKQINSFADRFLKNKRRIVLSSYSPASIVNSFRKNSEYVSIKGKSDYISYINRLVTTLNADYFIPFASQIILYRPDSSWANEYKVTIDDIRAQWNAKTELLNPYTTIDLVTFEHTFVKTQDYHRDEEQIAKKVNAQVELEKQADFTEENVEMLRKKLKFHRFFLYPLFPKGIGFITEKEQYIFNTLSGKLKKDNSNNYSFAVKVPSQALKDAVTYGHFGDLGITMFTILILNRTTNPKFIYIFFILLTLHDYKHTISFSNFFRWLGSSVKNYNWRIPAISNVLTINN